MKRLAMIAAAAAFGFAAQGAAAAGNAAAGKAKAAQVCAACHGAEGNKPVAPDQPVLAGQHADYLAKALADYKSGARNNAVMKGFAGGLSKQDMQDLAAWFASQPSGLGAKR